MNENTRDIPALTGLRGFAAVWVLARHYTNGTEGNGFWSDIAFHGGANGVMIFFVLSGFILSHVYRNQFVDGIRGKDYIRFLYFRFARIYPLHFFTLILWLVLFTVVVPRSGLPDMTSYTFILNLFLAQAWGFFRDYSWNAPSWTISVEWALYFIFPFALVAILSLRRYWMLATVIGAAVLALYGEPILLGNHNSEGFQYGILMISYALMFACGIAAYPVAVMMVKQSLDLFGGSLLVILGVGLLIYTCSIGEQFWLTTLAATLLVTGLYAANGVGHLVFGNRITVFLGEISYSLYMTHIMVLLILLPLDLPPLALPMLAITVATAVHFAIERPSRTALRRLWEMRRTSVVAQA
jgi:peptidoglycan/LPS O-acetylase OafA/YrhL